LLGGERGVERRVGGEEEEEAIGSTSIVWAAELAWKSADRGKGSKRSVVAVLFTIFMLHDMLSPTMHRGSM
jgi:hypothetical protein